ncbi:hypothetical protein CASFOL_033750 [Castilleja foliolosa]|uniref:MIF4G domain-containing protein n=1 Tax=Castilleja foliolosa TaxID=1961234 RepID=A0ABD3BYN4_9LAMI
MENSIVYQRLKWQSMEKRINQLVSKVNISNIQPVADQIMNLQQNLITARGPFCRAIMKSQSGCPHSSDVYASLVAIINSKFPDVGLLLVKRVVLQFKEAYDHKDEKKLRKTSKFLAHLINQEVVYEVVALDVMLLLLGNPSSDNIGVAVSFCLECGQSLLCSIPHHKIDEIIREFNRVLKKGVLRKSVQVSIVRLLAARRSRFRMYPCTSHELELVEFGEQVTHEVSLLHDISPETSLDDFDPKSGLDECDMFSRMMIGSRDSD